MPNILRDNVQQNRPLPQAPEDLDGKNTLFDGKFEDEIYCEIDEDMKTENSGESMNPILLEDSSSLSKEIFDTINKRVPSAPEKYLNGRQNETSSFRNFVSKFSIKNSAGNDSTPGPSWNLNLNLHPVKKVPSLPPKGTPSFAMSDEESEYKVPSSTLFPDSIYNVPSNIPVPVSQAEQHSGRYEDSNVIKETIKELPLDESSVGTCDNSNPQSETETLENKSSDTETENQLNEESSETTLKSKSQCVNESKPKTDEEVKINSFNSVKDMIAKLNQTDDSLETSQKSLGYSSFRKGKNSPNKFENAHLVECKNKLEISRSVKSIKENIEKGKLKLNISEEEDSDFEVNTNSNECTETYNNLKSTDDTENTRGTGNSVSTEDTKGMIKWMLTSAHAD